MKNKPLRAHVLPFAVFLLFLALDSILATVFQDSGWLWLARPKYWIYPLQTVVCAALVLWYWRSYDFGSLRPWFTGVLVGLVVLGLWVSPQAVFGFPPRTNGFNPDLFAADPTIYWLNLMARFTRMAVVVALVEEIFWRGFVLRYLINEDFTKVPFGTYSPLSFFGVAILFTLEHGMPDWPAALVTGLLYNALAIRTKSLWACVIAHGVTNFGLGLYVMTTKQWGFW